MKSFWNASTQISLALELLGSKKEVTSGQCSQVVPTAFEILYLGLSLSRDTAPESYIRANSQN